jgi:hypothetical protein
MKDVEVEEETPEKEEVMNTSWEKLLNARARAIHLEVNGRCEL